MRDNYTELYEKFSRLQFLLQRHHIQNHSQHGPFADPTRGQGRVLAILKLQPEISTKDLSYLLGIRQQSLNELLNKLEKSGYVARTPAEADRRVMLVQLTEKGKAEEQSSADFSDVFSCLTPEEQSTFADYLDRVIAALETQLGVEEDEEGMSDWEKAARMRMGDEMFDALMMMRSSFRGHSGHFGHGPHGHGHGGPGMHGCGPRKGHKDCTCTPKPPKKTPEDNEQID